jgi:alkylation response protein AidB-like acyl-CoA dehydrogenase
MDFRFTEDQLTLTESVRDYLAGTHGPEVLRRLDAGDKRDPAIWQGLVDMGLTALLVPEEQGGLGLGLIDAALIATECGRACLAEPLVEVAYVTWPWLLSRGELDDAEAFVLGGRTMPQAHAINPYWSDGVGLGETPSVDPLRLLYDNPLGISDDPHLLNLGALMSAAQLIGLAEAMLTQATEYAKIRTQFGQPIGAFQAIKHQLASCAVAIEFARPVVWRAAAAMQDGIESAPVHVSHAKVVATDAAMLTAETAIQVHGAMGYTYEVDLHFWMKRSWALAGAWGSRAFHLKRVDEAVLSGTLEIGPQSTFA